MMSWKWVLSGRPQPHPFMSVFFEKDKRGETKNVCAPLLVQEEAGQSGFVAPGLQ